MKSSQDCTTRSSYDISVFERNLASDRRAVSAAVVIITVALLPLLHYSQVYTYVHRTLQGLKLLGLSSP